VRDKSLQAVEGLLPVGSYVFHVATSNNLLLKVLEHRLFEGNDLKGSFAYIKTYCEIVGSTMEHEPVGKCYWVPPENLRHPDNPLIVLAMVAS